MFRMNHIILSVVVGASTLLLYTITNQRITRTKAARQHGCKPPFTYPHLDPIFVIDLKLQEILKFLHHQSLPFSTNLHTKYGKTYEAVYSTNHADWGYETLRLPVMGPFCGRGFVTTDGETWRKCRALLRPTFSRSNIYDLGVYKAAVERFLKCIPGDGRTTVDLQPLLANLDQTEVPREEILMREQYLETSFNFLIGVSPNTSNEQERNKATTFIQAFNSSIIGMGLSLMLGPFKFLLPKSLTTTAHKQVHGYIDLFVDKSLEKLQEETTTGTTSSSHTPDPVQKSLLEGLSEQTNDRIEIRQNVIQGMLAAQGTTYVLIRNTLFLLSRNPGLYKRLRDEVQHLDFEADANLFDVLRDQEFIHNILREALRLYPVFPNMGHIALRDTTLPRGGGPNNQSPIFIPRGTMMYVNQYALHRNKTVFGADAESFNPDRWKSINPSPWEYIPFGGGPRACVGQQKALVEAAYTLAKMAQGYRGLESQNGREWEGEWKLTAKNVNGCKVVCIPA
ncbi:cytochrome P450 alkane hydroxylase protein [Rutstroemia sp. NJR-2017a WRK4]|nr:cytochrome P450 alkane hydroxylase protein [Rutstroemia sp. NJR-2017a WRK4]